ncbi:MAG: hypothetical protein WKG06_18625 [Segetibacter sp.]
MVGFSGCFKNYFKINSSPISDSASLAVLKNSDKYFIIHLKNGFYALKNISADDSAIEGNLQKLPAEREKYIYESQTPGKTYKSRDKHLLFSEIHLYAQNETATDTNHISIPLTSVSRVDIYEKDTGRTIGSYVLGSLGIYLGINLLALLLVIIACNCPQVYTFDGNQYNFKSGVFSGAIYSSLEKTDYLPLDNLQSINGKYLFKLANNQKEEQFINQVQLINVEHDFDKQVLLDRNGVPYTYSTDVTVGQTENVSKEVAEAIKYKDGNVYMFNEQNDSKSSFGNVILNFDRKEGSNDGKLIIHAKNTLWSGYIFDEFSSMFGSKYQSWVSKQDKADRKVIEKWQQEQALPLMVYIETDKGWSFVDYFPFTGNTAGRDMIMKLKLPGDKRNVRVKIECTYMFWELDYAAMDFSIDEPVKINYLNPSVAVTDNNETKMKQVSAKDKEYAALKEDEAIKVEFDKAAEMKNKSNSLFLITTGYYHSTKEYSGKTQTANLYKFKKKGAFNQFSKMKYNYARQALVRGINFSNVRF